MFAMGSVVGWRPLPTIRRIPRTPGGHRGAGVPAGDDQITWATAMPAAPAWPAPLLVATASAAGLLLSSRSRVRIALGAHMASDLVFRAVRDSGLRRAVRQLVMVSARSWRVAPRLTWSFPVLVPLLGWLQCR